MYERLKASGWSHKEIAQLQRHYKPQREEWIVLFVAAVLVTFAVVAIPYAYAILGRLLPESLFFVTLFVLGLPLGGMFGLLLVDFERLQKQHHVGLLIALPLAAIIAGSFIFRWANVAGLFSHNALIGAIVYAVAFVGPYGFMVSIEWNSKIGSSTG